MRQATHHLPGRWQEHPSRPATTTELQQPVCKLAEETHYCNVSVSSAFTQRWPASYMRQATAYLAFKGLEYLYLTTQLQLTSL